MTENMADMMRDGRQHFQYYEVKFMKIQIRVVKTKSFVQNEVFTSVM